MTNSASTSQLVTLTINQEEKSVYVRNAETLLFTLRQQLGLMGAKPGCHNGDCGACTILFDDMPLNACHLLTVEAEGHTITTIEGIDDTVIPNIFVNQWALQCGYCTPGFIMVTYALKKQCPNASDAVIDEWLESNICRCTGYKEIREAVKLALQEGASHG